ncbi:hypothetical protein EJ05DRAFT_509382 [Pseudovirgaria hyperparasitica]|uniref:Uncharacterized protein n=1 Tax=Pseudovirgaria hyperparasitica TaxID=470096 RepID=A0A6A6WCT1_9PEZI|nr:uncharacterized protein EJ05DRAFT_509382 [Pseudovirgaria hyperparasitica]KAF2759656.1 hypothetical protein EJ05DRAFT_509382 [Pseudovirgaria hyperparasitica]
MTTPSKPTTNLRPPIPSLFIGPPSHNTSTTSLLPPNPPLTRQRSTHQPTNTTTTPQDPLARLRHHNQQHNHHPPNPNPSTAHTDAIWASMQHTLEEVELSALSGAHVFNTKHASALDELRTAQIALAQAWASSEADAESESESEGHSGDPEDARRDNPAAAAAAAGQTLLSPDRIERIERIATRARGESEASMGSEQTGQDDDDETRDDIAHARRRREANDRYFERVSAGVADVVARLEEVARAMRAVGQESREIWGDSGGESLGSGTSGSVG